MLPNNEYMEDNLVLALPAQPFMGDMEDGADLLPNDVLQAIQGPGIPKDQHDQPQFDLNLQVGFVMTHDPIVADPIFERFMM
jgi:hypothetical protein